MLRSCPNPILPILPARLTAGTPLQVASTEDEHAFPVGPLPTRTRRLLQLEKQTRRLLVVAEVLPKASMRCVLIIIIGAGWCRVGVGAGCVCVEGLRAGRIAVSISMHVFSYNLNLCHPPPIPVGGPFCPALQPFQVAALAAAGDVHAAC